MQLPTVMNLSSRQTPLIRFKWSSTRSECGAQRPRNMSSEGHVSGNERRECGEGRRQAGLGSGIMMLLDQSRRPAALHANLIGQFKKLFVSFPWLLSLAAEGSPGLTRVSTGSRKTPRFPGWRPDPFTPQVCPGYLAAAPLFALIQGIFRSVSRNTEIRGAYGSTFFHHHALDDTRGQLASMMSWLRLGDMN